MPRDCVGHLCCCSLGGRYPTLVLQVPAGVIVLWPHSFLFSGGALLLALVGHSDLVEECGGDPCGNLLMLVVGK